MSANSPINTVLFFQNRRAFTAEQLLPYFGQAIAFSADGTRVVAMRFRSVQRVLGKLRRLE